MLLRSMWDINDDLKQGRLLQVLPDYYQPADIWAVHCSPLLTSAKVRVAVDFVQKYFRERA